MATKKTKVDYDGHETERFVDLVRKLVAVSKTEVDKRIAEERKANDKLKNKRKA